MNRLNKSTEEWIYLYRLGREDAIEELLDQTRPIARGILRDNPASTLLPGEDQREYLMHADTLVLDCLDIWQTDRSASFLTYYRRACRNLLTDFGRRARRTDPAYHYPSIVELDSWVGDKDGSQGYRLEDVISDGYDLHEEVMTDSEIAFLHEYVLPRLTSKQKKVFSLRLEGYTYKEIAEQSGLSYRQVRGELERALFQARMLFRADLPAPDRSAV